jgi:hypothetical protein
MAEAINITPRAQAVMEASHRFREPAVKQLLRAARRDFSEQERDIRNAANFGERWIVRRNGAASAVMKEVYSLSALHKAGIITGEEFKTKKDVLFDRGKKDLKWRIPVLSPAFSATTTALVGATATAAGVAGGFVSRLGQVNPRAILPVVYPAFLVSGML